MRSKGALRIKRRCNHNDAILSSIDVYGRCPEQEIHGIFRAEDNGEVGEMNGVTLYGVERVL